MDEAPGINTRPSLMFPFSKIPIIETPNLKKCNFFFSKIKKTLEIEISKNSENFNRKKTHRDKTSRRN